MSSTPDERDKARGDELGLAKRILLGIVVGVLLGQLAHGREAWAWVGVYLADPIGAIWLNLLLVLMLPLASTALLLGMLGLEPREVGQIGARALGLTLLMTGSAVAVGLTLVSVVKPGAGVDPASLPTQSVDPSTLPGSAVELLIAQFPSNIVAAASTPNLVPVLIFVVLIGFALRKTKGEGAALLVRLTEGVFDVSATAVHMVLRLAPVGVAALTYELAARGGFEALLPVGRFVLVVLLAIFVQMALVYPLVLRFLGRYSPRTFYRAVRPAMAMAFSTASSAATLPTSLEVGDTALGLRRDTARFVLTVGATANQNGTALFEGLAVVFFAQLYNVDLTILHQAAIIGISVLAGIGTAGVPAGSLPVITAMIVNLGIPAEAIGVIVGVDRLLDMARTTLNVTGDLVIATVIAGPADDA